MSSKTASILSYTPEFQFMNNIAHPLPNPPPGSTKNASAFCVGTPPAVGLALQGRRIFQW